MNKRELLKEFQRHWNNTNSEYQETFITDTDINEFIVKYKIDNVKQTIKEPEEKNAIIKIKQAFSEYVQSEGCSCCQNIEEHEEASDKLGKLLNFKRFSDDSGYDFYK